jgi:hypothetical protein
MATLLLKTYTTCRDTILIVAMVSSVVYRER